MSSRSTVTASFARSLKPTIRGEPRRLRPPGTQLWAGSRACAGSSWWDAPEIACHPRRSSPPSRRADRRREAAARPAPPPRWCGRSPAFERRSRQICWRETDRRIRHRLFQQSSTIWRSSDATLRVRLRLNLTPPQLPGAVVHRPSCSGQRPTPAPPLGPSAQPRRSIYPGRNRAETPPTVDELTEPDLLTRWVSALVTSRRAGRALWTESTAILATKSRRGPALRVARFASTRTVRETHDVPDFGILKVSNAHFGTSRRGSARHPLALEGRRLLEQEHRGQARSHPDADRGLSCASRARGLGGRRRVQRRSVLRLQGNRGPGLEQAKARAVSTAAEHGRCVLVAQDADRFARGAGDAPGAADHLGEVYFAMKRQGVDALDRPLRSPRPAAGRDRGRALPRRVRPQDSGGQGRQASRRARPARRGASPRVHRRGHGDRRRGGKQAPWSTPRARPPCTGCSTSRRWARLRATSPAS